MKLESINFSQIFKDSWQITWKHRFLWWFGLLISLGSGISLQFPSFDSENGDTRSEMMRENWERIMDAYGTWIWIGVAILILLAIACWVLRTIGQGGIIRTLDQLNRGEATNFSSGFTQGKVYFWKIFFTDLIITAFLMILVIVFLVPIVFLFSNHSIGMGILLSLIAFVIFIPIAIASGFVRKYSYYYLVLSNIDIRAALENSYLVFRRNITPSLILALIFIPFSIIFMVAVLAAIFLVGILFVPLGALAYFILPRLVLYIVIGIGILLAVSAIMFIRSIFETFSQSVWYQFFKKIASEKEAEKVAEMESRVVSEKISEAGVYKAEEK